MEQKQIVNVISKSFGLLCLLYAFLDAKQAIIYLLSVTFYGDHVKDIYIYLGQLIISLLCDLLAAWIFIYKSELISVKLTSKSNERLEIRTTKSELIELVVIAIGALAVISSIPEILHKIIQYIYFNEYGRADKNLYWTDSNRKADIMLSIIKLAIGLIAMTNGKLVAKRLTRITD